VSKHAPMSVLGRSLLKRARDTRQDAAVPWPKGGKEQPPRSPCLSPTNPWIMMVVLRNRNR
jgi:hypothetical protein